MTFRLLPLLVLSLFLPALAHGANPPIAFTSPRGGELYIIGQAQKVVVAGKFKIVVVELSRDGGANFTALGTIDNRAIVDKSKLNQLPWNVTGPASNRAQIRVTGKNSLTDNRKAVTITSGDFSIAESATGLPDGSVTAAILADKSVTAAKIDSENASNGFLLFADGLGGAAWNAPPFVKIAGDTMTGPLLLSGDPAQALQAATKQYVDSMAGDSASKEELFFPDGIVSGSARALLIDTTGYTVPAGKNLYILTSSAGLKIDGDTVVGGGEIYVPILAGSGSIISATTSSGIITGFEVPATVASWKEYLATGGNAYIVPAGKTLFIVTKGSGTLRLNGEVVKGDSLPLRLPLVCPQGSVVTGDGGFIASGFVK